jgi:hypothetical protein
LFLQAGLKDIHIRKELYDTYSNDDIMQKKLFRTQQILFYLFGVVSLATLVLALAFMTDFKTLFQQAAGIGTFHDDVLQAYNRSIFSASLIMVVGAALVSFFDFRKAVSDYFGLGVLGVLTIFNVVKSISFISQLADMETTYLALDFDQLLLASGVVYPVTTRTFDITMIIYLLVIVISSVFFLISVVNTLIYFNKRKEVVTNG